MVVTITQAGALVPFRAWPPAGALLETVLDAARGEGGVSVREARRVSNWAHRLDALPPALWDFYAAEAGHWAVGVALWHALEGYPKPTGSAGAALHMLWRERYGRAAPHSLVVAGPRR